MNKLPPKRKKTTSASTSESKPLDDQNLENISVEENPATATITVTAVEIPELTEEEQRDKPNGMATLTACTWSGRWREQFLKQVRHWRNCAIADCTARPTRRLRNIAGRDLAIVVATPIF
ncbi:hypothetical protein [Nostoc sp. MG11]|uniref:hypothetical protein n=1 Tax=Nostoc sp. MG11 TaxID=2721166 RepID=UPI001D02FAAC|nr:hypothetical protein [Nostoc sp. MG11]